MKITKDQLQQIIEEELAGVIKESGGGDGDHLHPDARRAIMNRSGGSKYSRKGYSFGRKHSGPYPGTDGREDGILGLPSRAAELGYEGWELQNYDRGYEWGLDWADGNPNAESAREQIRAKRGEALQEVNFGGEDPPTPGDIKYGYEQAYEEQDKIDSLAEKALWYYQNQRGGGLKDLKLIASGQSMPSLGIDISQEEAMQIVIAAAALEMAGVENDLR
jgi:hypothetical protein